MTNIASIDLNLLVAFEALLEERSVTRAAARVGLSQPAMSIALGRLRGVFRDPLFHRTGRGMIPTALALRLGAPVRGGLAQLRSALAGPPAFRPTTSTRSFRLGMIDYAEMVLLGPLLHRVQASAPGVQLFVRRLEHIFIAPEEDLRAGTFDAAIGFFPDASGLDSATHAQDLFQEVNVCIARKGNPLLRRPMTAQQFASAAQLGVFYRSETHGLIDNVLAGQGLRRRLVATTPHFLTVPHLVAESDVIAVVPAGLARRFRKLLPLEVRRTPVALPPLHMRLLWHDHTQDDPAQQWLRAVLVGQVRPALR
jgi:DNA-binding transcriptional LysR family regulator